MLAAIGLDERQESAYRALVGLGAAEVADLAHRLGLPEPETERVLRRLESQGLAARSSARTGRWVAAPPAVALGPLLTRQRQGLEQAELAAIRLAEEYRAEAAEPAVPDLVEVVSGASAVDHRLSQLLLGARDEVCALVVGGAVPVTGGAVACRVVVEREALSLPGGVGELSALGPGVRVRVADRVPARLVVADRSPAMVPLTGPDAEPVALVVHASGLLESLTALFEAVWREAVPLCLGAGDDDAGGPDATDLEILSLLLAGLTDASVAKQLDLGLRTVQRRVRGLMERAGVTTRLQLGWHARERGWVTRA
ncbi:helix-turn-helix transcriptional regulator [Streptomyces ficellus]|uniref:Helix-turn-helix transcriptional regulator n=1 Tax=Streptomyces ficellus TaxID=1977088 RepID=A0A6I6FFS7_9ACTN|nr:LuxR family transcriptional regulator [Streptomyces ficellus]QGV77915.1 helix-turn-helix transcriptional regulator [Streptomyces ficellus]